MGGALCFSSSYDVVFVLFQRGGGWDAFFYAADDVVSPGKEEGRMNLIESGVLCVLRESERLFHWKKKENPTPPGQTGVSS